MILRNKTKNTLVATDVRVADTWLSRMTGLLNRSDLPGNEAFLITRCRSIHMFFMRFPIDVLFVDKDDRVAGVVQNIRPFQLSPIFFRARCAIELRCGTIQESRTEVGDQLEFS